LSWTLEQRLGGSGTCHILREAVVELSDCPDHAIVLADAGSDVCFAPVLRIGEAYEHPHNIERETFVEAYGLRSLRLRRASVAQPA